jgi:hypothetical protein
MRNSFETAVQLKRIDICDLMLACLAAQSLANDGGEKWNKLHEKLKKQLNALDAQLDMISE